MFLVQVTARQSRLTGMGETIEQAAIDLFKHFRPDKLVINHNTTRVYHKCGPSAGFEPLPEEDMPAAVRAISGALNRS